MEGANSRLAVYPAGRLKKFKTGTNKAGHFFRTGRPEGSPH